MRWMRLESENGWPRAMAKLKESLEQKRARMGRILRVFKRTYPDARCSLNYSNPFELLISTILSAQSTDKGVNLATPELFKRFPDARAMAAADVTEIERLIKTTGFYKTKAKSLLETSCALVEKHGGEVPRTLESLVELRGVGRKTANVVLGNAYGIPGLVVDTHVGRLTRRMGFTRATDPVKVEGEMMPIVPREDWTIFSHLLIFHGRARCQARKPDCAGCEIQADCPRVGV